MTTMESGREGFAETLRRHGLELRREATCALQVNVGVKCDLCCRHCHLEAGPDRGEVMERQVMEQVIDSARRLRFSSVDITGGSPELVPGLGFLLRSLAPLTPRLIVRTNLTALGTPEAAGLCELYRDLKVEMVASLPSTNLAQTEAQRGAGVFGRCVEALKMLNALGYGAEGSKLQLGLVSNPAGAFLPPGQLQAEKKFRADLMRRYGVSFSALYTFANSPLGRFRDFLEASGNLEPYLERLREGFNPCAVAGLMCRRQLSVDWRGRLFDCDFHLAAGVPLPGGPARIGELQELPRPGAPVAVADHCYACTVGSGFT